MPRRTKSHAIVCIRWQREFLRTSSGRVEPPGIILWDSLRYPSHPEALGLSSVGSALVVDSQVDPLVIMVSNSGPAPVPLNPDL